MSVKCSPLFVKDAFLIECCQYKDNRGFFEEIYNVEEFPPEIGLKTIPQLSCSHSEQNVFRGLHCTPYYKLVTCVSGEGYDIIADLREDSLTYLKWVRIRLSASNHRQVYVPPYCGHGFYATQANTVLVYAQGGTYSGAKDRAVSWRDPVLNVDLPLQGLPVVSEKDKNAECLEIDSNVALPRRKRFLVIGASGKLGIAIGSYVKKHCADILVFGTHFQNDTGENTIPFDLEEAARDESYAEDMIDFCCPQVVIICGSWTNVRQCDAESAKSAAVMCKGPIIISEIAKRRGIKVVSISTDYVFDGKRDPARGPYTESDEANSTTAYGKNKHEMEKGVLQVTEGKALIVRTSTVNGRDRHQAGAFYTLFDRLMGESEFLVPEVVRTPTYVNDLAEIIVRLIEINAFGIVHACGDEIVTMPDYFRSVASAMGLNPDLVKLREQNEYQPSYSALSSEKRRKLLPNFKSKCVIDTVKEWMTDEAEFCRKIPSKYSK